MKNDQIILLFIIYFIGRCYHKKWIICGKNLRKTTEWLIYDFSGLRHIFSKIFTTKNTDSNPPSTFVLWAVSIYFAAFAVASTRYENYINRIENRTNAFITQISNTDKRTRADSWSSIKDIQNMKCPIKPDLFSPSSIFTSFFINVAYEESYSILKEAVENYKIDLCNANFHEANLRGINLKQADLSGAILDGSDIQGANFVLGNLSFIIASNAQFQYTSFSSADLHDAVFNCSDLTYANLSGANLSQTYFQYANLQNANLCGANFEGANLAGANFHSAQFNGAKGLSVEQLCSSESLYQSQLDKSLKLEVSKLCPNILLASSLNNSKRESKCNNDNGQVIITFDRILPDISKGNLEN